MENEKLLRKLANSYSFTTGVEFDDLFQEACIAYLEAMKSFDPNKSKLSTYVWKCVSSHLKNYVKLEKPYLEAVSIETPEVMNKPGLSVTNFFDALSFEAQQIAKIMFQRQGFYTFAKPVEREKKIRQTLIRRGWDEKKIRVGLHELELVCQ
jgi:RNA polymerase sigma factor (sigma-70 family)